MKRPYFLLVLVFTSFCFGVSAQTAVMSATITESAIEQANQKAQSFVEEGKLAGISTMIIQNGEVISQEFFGYANRETEDLVNHNTLFRIFSMTKPITSVALMTLYDQGKFDLDDPVAKYIPAFKNTSVYNGDISPPVESQNHPFTIRELLTHTSGITYGWDPESPVDSLYRLNNVGNWKLNTLKEEVDQLVRIPLKYQPGTRWEYGLGIDLAGYLIEVLSGQPLDKFLKEVIFDPLDMEQTGFYVTAEDRDRLAGLYGYNKQGALESVDNAMSTVFLSPRTFFSGGGGLVSSLEDYADFCMMLRNHGELRGKRILASSTVDLIMSDQLPEGVTFNENSGYGLGGSYHPGTDTYGWAGAASTKFWIDRSRDLIVIFYAQLMPSDFTFADAYYEALQRSPEH